MPFGAISLDKTLPLPLVPDGAGEEEEGGEPPCLKLECVASWRLFSWVQSIASVRLAGADRDSLLLAFKNTKLSLVVCNLGANRFIVQELMLDGPVQVSKSYLTQCENPICRLPAWRTPTWPCWRPMASALC